MSRAYNPSETHFWTCIVPRWKPVFLILMKFDFSKDEGLSPSGSHWCYFSENTVCQRDKVFCPVSSSTLACFWGFLEACQYHKKSHEICWFWLGTFTIGSPSWVFNPFEPKAGFAWFSLPSFAGLWHSHYMSLHVVIFKIGRATQKCRNQLTVG